jgi:Polyketide cyclase / dehydrase and lipid transport
MVQRHEYSIELNAPPDEVWEVFWYRAPDRPQPKDVKTRIEILHPGDDAGNGLVRHCYFPVPKWLLSRGVGQSWEWLTEVKPFESWRYDAVGKPLWSRATGWTRLTDLGDGRTRVTFVEEYEAFNPVMRLLLEKTVHSRLSRDNDTILAALEGGLRWHWKRRAREADATTERAAEN